MKTIFTALFALFLTSSVSFAACGVSSPVNVPVVGDALTEIHNGGDWEGTYNLQGSADCSKEINDAAEQARDEALALSSAMSAPVWLGEGENFRISGGIGFTDGETAVGATALARINRNVAAYGGAAVNSDAWAGKAGLSIGW